MTQPKARSQACNSAEMGTACLTNVLRSLSRSDGVRRLAGARRNRRKRLTFTEVRYARAVLFNIRVENCDCLALRCNLAPKRGDRGLCLFSLLALVFQDCQCDDDNAI